MTRKPQVHIDDSIQGPMREALEKVDNIPVPMPKRYGEKPELVGQTVTVYRCHGNKHEPDNEGCLCDMIGQEIEISGIYENPFVETPSYHIKGSTKRIQEREFVPVQQKYEEGELERVKRVLGHDYVE